MACASAIVHVVEGTPRNGHAHDCGPQSFSRQHPGKLTRISRGADLGFSQITAPATGPQGCPDVSPTGL